MSLADNLPVALEAARGAARIILDKFGRVERLTKRHAEAVTEADRASQRFIVERLRKHFPTDGIIGEENETGDAITFDCPNPRGRVWVIDPIDGTNNFIAGLANFAVSIGLLEDSYPVLGVVLDVCRDIPYTAVRSHGAFVGDRRAHVLRSALSPQSIVMLTASLLDPSGRLPGYTNYWLGHATWRARMIGSAALEAASVAAGVSHASLTVNGKLWDVAAPAALVLEAGGLVTDLAGKNVFPFDLTHYDGAKVPFLAGAPAAHAELLKDILAHP